MKTVVLEPSEILPENGRMLAVWGVTYRSNSLRSFGEELTRIDRAVIPIEFAGVVEEARRQGKPLSVWFLPTSGEQTATRVEIV